MHARAYGHAIGNQNHAHIKKHTHIRPNIPIRHQYAFIHHKPMHMHAGLRPRAAYTHKCACSWPPTSVVSKPAYVQRRVHECLCAYACCVGVCMFARLCVCVCARVRVCMVQARMHCRRTANACMHVGACMCAWSRPACTVQLLPFTEDCAQVPQPHSHEPCTRLGLSQPYMQSASQALTLRHVRAAPARHPVFMHMISTLDTHLPSCAKCILHAGHPHCQEGRHLQSGSRRHRHTWQRSAAKSSEMDAHGTPHSTGVHAGMQEPWQPQASSSRYGEMQGVGQRVTRHAFAVFLRCLQPKATQPLKCCQKPQGTQSLWWC